MVDLVPTTMSTGSTCALELPPGKLNAIVVLADVFRIVHPPVTGVSAPSAAIVLVPS